LLENLVFVKKFSFKNATFGAESPHFEKIEGKIKILSALSEICCVYRRIAIFSPAYS